MENNDDLDAGLAKSNRSAVFMSDATSTPQSDDDLLALLRKSAPEEHCFLTRNGKEERERWVVSEFLQLLPLDFAGEELHSPPQCSKTDVAFREANFQVKEVLNPGVKRNDEAREQFERIIAAKNLQDIIGTPFVYDVPSPTTIYSLVSDEAHSLAIKSNYLNIKDGLDLLFYVTRTHASLVKQDEIDINYLASLGWRSISCLAGNQAIVLFANSHAPAFLRPYRMATN